MSASSRPRSLARRHGAAPPFAFCQIKSVEASGIRRLAASLLLQKWFPRGIKPQPHASTPKVVGEKKKSGHRLPGSASDPSELPRPSGTGGVPGERSCFGVSVWSSSSISWCLSQQKEKQRPRDPAPSPGAALGPPGLALGVLQEGFGDSGLLQATPEAGRGLPGGSRGSWRCPGAAGALQAGDAGTGQHREQDTRAWKKGSRLPLKTRWGPRYPEGPEHPVTTTAPPVLRNRAENPGKVPGCSCAEGFLLCHASPSPRPAPNLLGRLRNSPARSLAPVGSAPGAGAPRWPWDGCAALRGRTARPGLQGHFVLSHTPGWVWG